MEKGLDRKMAEYFSSEGTDYNLKAVAYNENDIQVGNVTLTLTFDNGERRCLDIAPLLKTNTVFEPFMDIGAFRRVYLDDNHCISWDIDPNVDSNEIWSNKVDLCPDCCYVDSVPIAD